MDYTRKEYNTAYEGLLRELDSYESCDLFIPRNWSVAVLECVRSIVSICPTIMLGKIHKVNDRLVIEYELDTSDIHCRPYIEDEIYFANQDIKEENEMGGLLYGNTTERCCVCNDILTSFTKVVGEDSKKYCKYCYVKHCPPTLIVKESRTGVKIIGNEVVGELDIEYLRRTCKWFLRRKTVTDKGVKTYYFEYRGEQVCREFSKIEKKLPTFWARCNQYGKCPF